MTDILFDGLLANCSGDAQNHLHTTPGCSALETVRKVGEGSFAEVYIAQWDGDEVAIKVWCCVGKQ